MKNDFFKLPNTKILFWTLCGVLAILIAYGLGILVGYRRAIFAADFGERYYRTMYGNPMGQPMIGAMGYGPLTMHGVAGEVIDISTGTIVVKDANGDEESVLVMSNTPIREMNNDITAGDIVPNDQIVVIGQPDTGGQVEARFIRVFETSSSLPLPPGSQ